MTLTRWKLALLAAVAFGGIAWAGSAEWTVTIQQNGGLPETCRILRTWTTKDGQKAWLLESLDSEEQLTVVQTDSEQPGATEVHTLIYRWANSITPPPGSPIPPVQILPPTEPRMLPAPVAVPAPKPSPMSLAEFANAGRHSEKPAAISFKSGERVPVPAPASPTNYGYYPTQWRRWPDDGQSTKHD